jgi:hypothetical protein
VQPRPQARRRYRARRAWVASLASDWIFDAKVKHHWGDWKITIEIGRQD